MKRLILFELLLLFLATTFESDSPPGWYQQSIPLGNKLITDIQFLDSLNGYVVTDWGPAFDTGYVFKTNDGGNNWNFQYRFHGSFTAIQMTDVNTGYITGSTGSGKIWKTTNGGNNWNIHANFSANPLTDLAFVNRDTGWVCSDDPLGGGIFKTSNGGLNWLQQLSGSFFIKKIFFINKDTGWAGSFEANGKIYRTTNGGQIWNLQYTSNGNIESIFFLNGQKGWARGGTGNGVIYTSDGGANWQNAQGEVAGYDIKFVTDSIGYSGGTFMKIMKSNDGGRTWGYQNSPIFTALQTSFFKNDTLIGWAGTNGLIKTTDGGGPITFTGITQINSEVPIDYQLFQNYPNPFNPNTNIKYQLLHRKHVKLIVFDITGKEIATLVNEEQSTGTYKVDWDASGFSSGIYIYTLYVDSKVINTKKMALIK